MLRRFASLPFRDFAAAIDAPAANGIVLWSCVIAAFVVAWFVYVPVHELMHAYGCILAGGEVTRLEIATEYGGALLARIFPFVVAGSAYAGQLTGFDARGSDTIYLVTVFAPYLLTIVIGVPLLQHVSWPIRWPMRWPMRHPAARAWLFGASLPLAYAPFISLTGDYYEAGSIAVTRIAHALDPALAPERLRSDDLFTLAATLNAQGASVLDWTIVTVSFVAGVLLALLTYHCGAVFARINGVRHR